MYGTTYRCGASGYGTVFEIDTSGAETLLHSFSGSDGEYPDLTSLLMDAKGNIYGDTSNGGDFNCEADFGCGTVYKLSKSGTLTVLHSFTGGTTDGCSPLGTLTMDKDGNLYGTTEGCGFSNVGTVWKVSKAGSETVLYNFAGYPSDGAYPFAGVIRDAKGNLYGETSEGGSAEACKSGSGNPIGCGTVFKLSGSGKETVLHSFDESDGAFPIGGLVIDTKASLYGTAGRGGYSGGWGTVWKLTP